MLTSAAEYGRWTLPGFVDEFVWQLPQLRAPPPHEGAAGVTGQSCIHRVHHKVPVVQTAHASVLPHHGINSHIRIHQSVLYMAEMILYNKIACACVLIVLVFPFFFHNKTYLEPHKTKISQKMYVLNYDFKKFKM